MIRFERGSWLGQVFSFHGTIIEQLWWPTLLYFVYCIVMFAVGGVIELTMSKSTVVRDDDGSVHFLGGFVSFLLIFQLNQCYSRLMQAIALSADFFSHLYSIISITCAYLKRDGVRIDDELELLKGGPAKEETKEDWQRRELRCLLALAMEIHVLRLVIAIGASLKLHFRIAEQTLLGGRLSLEKVQLLLFDLHRVRGLLLPNERAIVDLASGLCLEEDELEGSRHCYFRVRHNYQAPDEGFRGEQPQLRRLGAGTDGSGDEDSYVGIPLPLLLVQLLRGHLPKAMSTHNSGQAWGYPERVVSILEKHLAGVCSSLESLDRLITLPFPLSYLQHCKALFLIFTLVYPCCIETSLGFWANVVSPTIIFFALLGFELLADELENPLGDGHSDLNVMEMVHALEVRACKAFFVAELQHEALLEDSRGLLEGLGLEPRMPPELPKDVRERLERLRSFSRHFRWLRLPGHVTQDVARPRGSAIASEFSTLGHRGLSVLKYILGGGKRLERWLARRRLRRSRAGYGRLNGCEEEATAAEAGCQSDMSLDGSDALECGVTHFLCLQSQEEALRAVCSEMQACTSADEDSSGRAWGDDPDVGKRLVDLLTGGEEAMPGAAASRPPSSRAQPAGEASSSSGQSERSSSEAERELPMAHRYTIGSKKLSEFALRFAPMMTGTASGKEASEACDALHRMGPPTVILTTLDVPDATQGGESVALLLSQACGRKWLLRLPFIDGGPFTGTGDLTAAMILAWTQLHPHEAPVALEKAGAVLQAVLRRTISLESARTIGDKRVPPELRIIDCKRAVESPAVSVRCSLLEPLGLRGIVFDMDGTLTLPGQIDFARMRERVGVPTGDIVTGLRERHAGDPEGLAKAMAAIEDEERRAFDPPRLQPGLQECIQHLRRAGLQVGLATRNGPACVDVFLEHAGLPAGAFSPVVTRDSGLPNKPDPAPVLHCCREWGLEPSSVLMVGDHVDDLRCGHAAGSLTAAMLWPGASPGEDEADVERMEALAKQEQANAALAEVADFTLSSLEALKRLVAS